jgi:predicted metal-dependent hydrolase
MIGGTITVEGRVLNIVAGPVRTAKLAGETVLVPNDPTRVSARLVALLKVLAQDRLLAASDRYAMALGRPHIGISLRDTKSRWGSCSPEGKLMYSWRLIFAPPAVLEYVAAHEVAHLAEMNHGPRFWSTLKRLMPDYEVPMRWLKRHGQDLHLMQFSQG